MKTFIAIFILFLILFSCQELPVKEIQVEDGNEYQYTLLPRQDSLRYYNPGQDTFSVHMTFKQISTGFPLPDLITEVDDAVDEWNTTVYTPMIYSGDNILNPNGWSHMRDQIFDIAHYRNTMSYLQTDGWVEHTFTGYKIEWFAERFESYGIAGVSIDKGPEVMVDLYRGTNINNSELIFTADSLDNAAQHTIRVRYTAQRNPNSNHYAARINHDKFVTYVHQGVYYPVPKEAKQFNTYGN